jgi:hypothetical protein
MYMTQDVPQFIRDAMDAASQHAEETVDWPSYFERIIEVCPWAKAYYLAGKIDFGEWQGPESVPPLGEYVARIWTHTDPAFTPTDKFLQQLGDKQNASREGEEWLWSNPVMGNSTPVPILIQQCETTLARARATRK